MAKAAVKLNRKGIASLVAGAGVRYAVDSAAQRVEISVSNLGGSVHGYPLRVWRDANMNRQSPPRPRGAVIVTHPTPKGRSHGRRVLRSVMMTVFGGDARLR